MSGVCKGCVCACVRVRMCGVCMVCEGSHVWGVHGVCVHVRVRMCGRAWGVCRCGVHMVGYGCRAHVHVWHMCECAASMWARVYMCMPLVHVRMCMHLTG